MRSDNFRPPAKGAENEIEEAADQTAHHQNSCLLSALFAQEESRRGRRFGERDFPCMSFTKNFLNGIDEQNS